MRPSTYMSMHRLTASVYKIGVLSEYKQSQWFFYVVHICLNSRCLVVYVVVSTFSCVGAGVRR
jgi:hypothetical protein